MVSSFFQLLSLKIEKIEKVSEDLPTRKRGKKVNSSMATRSSEKQGTPQSEGLISSPRRGEKDYLKPKLMIQPKNVMEEIEECKTPTWSSGNQITTMLECPPAPRKKRRPTSPISSHRMRKSPATDDHDQLNFFEETKPEDVDLFFQSIYEFDRANKI
ncbi:hypothetical protein CR513_56803, partial [Mucuna pruriens]